MLKLVKKMFSLDFRSLALFRIAFGIIVICDTVQKLYWCRDFYTDWGFYPRSTLYHSMQAFATYSLHALSGELWLQVILLGSQLLAAVFFLLGWHTRIANVILFTLVGSMHARNPVVLSGADAMLMAALFWANFVPSEARFSLDAVRKNLPKRTDHFSIGGVGLIIQLLYVYFFTVILKTHPMWTLEYSAVYYATHVLMFSKPFSIWLRDKFYLTALLTKATILWEFFGPLLALAGPRLRTLACSGFIFFHLGLFFSLELGLFSFIAIAFWIALFPSLAWQGRLPFQIENFFDIIFLKLSQIIWRSLPSTRPTQSLFHERRWVHRINSALAAIAVLFITLINLNSLNFGIISLDQKAKKVAAILRIDQYWTMFAPVASIYDGWFVTDGLFENGTRLDLLTEKPPTNEKPLIPSAYPSAEWRKYLMLVASDEAGRFTKPLSEYLCRRFSISNGAASNLISVSISFVNEATPPPGLPAAAPVVHLLLSHNCKKENLN